MPDDFDPEMLGPVEKIRHAEALIRREHRVLDDNWLFWGNLADYLNDIAHVPEKTSQRPSDWRAFNRAQDMATGYIRMSAAPAVTFDITAPAARHALTQALDDYAAKEAALAADGDNPEARAPWEAAARAFLAQVLEAAG